MNKKIKDGLDKTLQFFKRMPRLIQARSISTQLIITIILIFASFFVLQAILNIQFFRNFYAEQKFIAIEENILEYYNKMNNPEYDYYDVMYEFTDGNNYKTVVTTKADYRILVSSETDYSFVIKDSLSNEEYTILVPNNDHVYAVGDTLTVAFYNYNDKFEYPTSIESQGSIFYEGEECDTTTCPPVTGQIIAVNKPNNLNFQFYDSSLVTREVAKLASDSFDLEKYRYMEDGYWYKSTDGAQDTLVFVHEIRSWHHLVTVVEIDDPEIITGIIASYNYYVYLTAIAIILIWSFRLSSIISKPIQNIELVAREIASLNFNVEAHEYNNRENESLSKSINLISRNLKETLETVNTKNKELTDLYEDQSKQVALKKQLVSSISHELKTPLMIMQVTIQGILDGIINQEDVDDELNNVLLEINKSSYMIQDMLQIYRLDDANTTLEISEFNLSELVCSIFKEFETAIKKYNFEMDYNLDETLTVEADIKLIRRVISNFITNSIKYTPEKEKIYVEVSDLGDKLYFELTNYGAHIPNSEINNIWIPFYRIDKDDERRLRTKGSGIGLYLVSEVLKAHNADFGIESDKNSVKAYFTLNKKME